MDFDEYLSLPLPFEQDISCYFHKNQSLIIFDIGTCEGEDSIRLQKRFPKATVYSFEPLPHNIKKIEANFEEYLVEKNLHQVALSDNEGTAEFHVSSGHPDHLPKKEGWDYGNKSSSLLQPKEHKKVLKWVKFNKKISVKTQRLDNFCKEHSIDRIDFIYMDVQGAELMVLEGAGSMLNKVSMIWMEVEAIELYKGQPLKLDVEKFMKRRGFVRIKDTVDNISGDQLYIHKSLPKRNAISRIYNTLSSRFP